jgi:hypothetical protein
MCVAIWITGSACAHIGYQPDGTAIPLNEQNWWAHGVWDLDGSECRKYAKYRAHCTGSDLQKPTYRELTRDMAAPIYQLCEPREIFDEDGVKLRDDARCTKCLKREVGSNRNYGDRNEAG